MRVTLYDLALPFVESGQSSTSPSRRNCSTRHDTFHELTQELCKFVTTRDQDLTREFVWFCSTPFWHAQFSRVPTVSCLFRIGNNRFPLFASVCFQTVTLLGLSKFDPPLCDCCSPASNEPTGTCNTHPFIRFSALCDGPFPSVHGNGESHARNIRSRITKAPEPFDEPPRVLGYPVFSQVVPSFLQGGGRSISAAHRDPTTNSLVTASDFGNPNSVLVLNWTAIDGDRMFMFAFFQFTSFRQSNL